MTPLRLPLRIGLPIALAALLGSNAALPQESAERHEIGVRYWLSQGETQWNHTAGAPSLGSPTSLLRYERLEAHAAELHFRRFLRRDWFVRGDVGIGAITKGSLDDIDYGAMQITLSDTTSRVDGNSLRYLTLDAAKVIADAGEGRPQVYLFAGYQYWFERYDAFGLTYRTAASSSQNLGTQVPVIRNETHWNSMRVGIGGRYSREPYLFSVDLALVPYTDLQNNDFHYLRADLGPVPNIWMDGSGFGWQLDAQVRRALAKNLDLGFGLRYWTLKADGAIAFGGGPPLRLNDLESRRFGFTATLVRKY